MQATSTTIRTQRFSKVQAENEAAAEVAARLSAIEQDGRTINMAGLDMDSEMTLKGEKFLVTLAKLNGELAVTFTSFVRVTGRQVEAIIEGRTTYAQASHNRRVLVTAAGHIWVEVDGRLALSPNKYEAATREILARLSALGIWQADKTAYTTPQAFAKAA